MNDPKTCDHPELNDQVILEADRLATKFADSRFHCFECPDCGRTGYPFINADDDIEFPEEPRNAGA